MSIEPRTQREEAADSTCAQRDGLVSTRRRSQQQHLGRRRGVTLAPPTFVVMSEEQRRAVIDAVRALLYLKYDTNALRQRTGAA